MDLNSTDVLLRSLGDSVRRQLVRVLAEAPLTVGEIVDVLGLPQSTVSRHLKTLRSTGLLVDRREGNRVHIGLAEPSGNGDSDLAGLLNSWIRQQELPRRVRGRLDRTLAGRNGSDNAFERLAHQWDEPRFEHFGPTFHLEALASLLLKKCSPMRALSRINSLILSFSAIAGESETQPIFLPGRLSGFRDLELVEHRSHES